MFSQVWYRRHAATLLTVLAFAGTGAWFPAVAAETTDDVTSSASASGKTCSAPTCAKPPVGCSYERASACDCGTLKCAAATPGANTEPLRAALSADTNSGQTAFLAVILSAIAGLIYLAHAGTSRALRPRSFDMARENRRHPTFHD